MKNKKTAIISRRIFKVIIFTLCASILPIQCLAKQKNLSEMEEKELEKEWKKGNAEACYRLAEMYLYGLNGVKPNMQLALMRCGNAVDMGHPGAQLLLGNMYEEGIENYIVKSESIAKDYYKKVLANTRISSYPQESLWKVTAANKIGKIHYILAMQGNEDEIKQKNDFEESLKYLKIAEEEIIKWKGDEDKKKSHAVDVYRNLANTCLMESLFCGTNLFSEELHYRKLCADYGDEAAKYSYALTLYYGNDGIKPDKGTALPIFLDIYENGSKESFRIEALYILASDYYEKEDYKKALQAFEKLLLEPDLFQDARCFLLMKLAAMYRFGRGVAADESKADAMTEEANKLGDPDAQKIRQWLMRQ